MIQENIHNVDVKHHEFGKIIGKVKLIDCVKIENIPSKILQSNYKFISGPYCWIFEQPIIFKRPIPYLGKQGLYDVIL